MNKTELKVFLKGLANFYVVLMIIAFLPTPGKDCSPGRLVRCIIIYDRKHRDLFGRLFLEPNQKGSG